MDSYTTLFFLTCHEMEGAGFKSFSKEYLSDFQTFIILKQKDFDFSLFPFSDINDSSILVIDVDDFDIQKLMIFLSAIQEKNIKCVLYSRAVTPGFLLKTHQLLLSGYISKSSPLSTILNCIKVIDLKGCYFDSIFDSVIRDLNKVFPSLSQMEKQLFYNLLISDELSIKDIADISGISKHSAEVHLSHIYKKTETSNFSELIKKYTI